LEQGEIHRFMAAFLMILAAITDYLDGYFARKYDDETELGKIIDPLADKLAVGVIAVTLYLNGMLPEYILIIVVARDLLIFTGGLMISNIIGKVLPSNMLGKITVLILGIYLLALVMGLGEYQTIFNIYNILIIFMCVISLIGYIIRSIEALRFKKNELL
jgi:CDP-diacylglycerol--glycerol-3-phosphate 3-phosphatidyltransferase